MQFEIIPTKQFEDDLRYYLKKKKFKHILEDVDDIVKMCEMSYKGYLQAIENMQVDYKLFPIEKYLIKLFLLVLLLVRL